MKKIEKDALGINASNYKVEYYEKDDRQTRGGWQCYCEFYRVYEGGKKIAEIDEGNGEVWINGRLYEFVTDNTVDRIELLRVSDDGILVYYPYGNECREFDFDRKDGKRND